MDKRTFNTQEYTATPSTSSSTFPPTLDSPPRKSYSSIPPWQQSPPPRKISYQFNRMSESSTAKKTLSHYLPVEFKEGVKEIEKSTDYVLLKFTAVISHVFSDSKFDSKNTVLIVEVTEDDFVDEIKSQFGNPFFEILTNEKFNTVFKFPFGNKVKDGFTSLKVKISAEKLDKIPEKDEPAILYLLAASYTPFGQISTCGLSLRVVRIEKDV